MSFKSPDRVLILDNPSARPREAFSMDSDYQDLIPEFSIPNQVDFRGIDRYYGNADLEGDVTLLKEDVLNQLRYCKDNQTMWAINFVVDAWSDLAAKMRYFLNKGRIIAGGPYANPVVFEAWKSPDIEYDIYMKYTVYPLLTEHLKKPKENRSIRSFQGFLSSYSRFCKAQSLRLPITRTGFVESRFFDVACTGLVLNLSNPSKGNKSEAAEQFVNDPNFAFFADVAKQHGFLIDKNNPSRIVANLRSPAMQRYMAERGFDTVQDFFQQSCDKSHLFDMVALEVYTKDMYETFLVGNPYVTTHKTSSRIGCDTKSVALARSMAPSNSFGEDDSIFAKKWSLSTYFFVRTNERNLKISPNEHKITLRTLYTLNQIDGGGYDNAFQFLIDRIIGPVI